MGYSRMKEATAEDHEVDEKIKGVFGQEISLGWKTSSLAKRPLSPCFSNSPNKSPNKRCPPEETKYILMVKPLILIRRVPFRGNDLGSLNRYSYNNNIGQCMNNMICHLSVLHLRLSHILHELVRAAFTHATCRRSARANGFQGGVPSRRPSRGRNLSESGIKALRCDLTLVLHKALIYQSLRIG